MVVATADTAIEVVLVARVVAQVLFLTKAQVAGEIIQVEQFR
jgi:hypothetical protein